MRLTAAAVAPTMSRHDPWHRMTDPRHTLRVRFDEAIVAAFGDDQSGTDPLLRRSQQERFGDYQANVAMSLSKRLGADPRQVAAAIVTNLHVDDVCERVDVAGPGFVNLTLRSGYLGAELGATAADPRLGVLPAEAPERVVVDYSAPNVAKEMHVGHLRTTIIGHALANVYEQLGHAVERANHIGDWGTQFGILIAALEEAELDGDPTVSELLPVYQAANARFGGDEGFRDRARQRVVDLQAGEPRAREQWRSLVELSRRENGIVYDLLGVHGLVER
ncbi:MAG: arginine--tRNA ligase, partial [Actinomycetota bacterium]|nr:arginine--tRNA ligase [Actinomycetota bacterium]